MNLLLVRLEEIEDESRVVLRDRRAEHCKKVLKARPGDVLRAGIVGRGRCSAQVAVVTTDRVELELGPLEPTVRPCIEVALAIPRPKALSRMISACASFGVDSVTLFNAWRVDKSYLKSPRLGLERLEQDLLLGLEQGMLCHLPHLRVFKRFVEFIDNPCLANPSCRIVLSPRVGRSLSQIPQLSKRVLLVLGPDGGFIQPELDSLREKGFVAAELGTGPLRTETALAAALGQLALLRNC